MGASSVTGVSGPGDSQGKVKPDNQCSCSCSCKKGKCPVPPEPRKTVCTVSVNAGNRAASINVGSGRSITVCP